jgi:hypothetical protein
VDLGLDAPEPADTGSQDDQVVPKP